MIEPSLAYPMRRPTRDQELAGVTNENPKLSSAGGSTTQRNADGRPPVCIDAFCGSGGLSLGLREAGFDVLAAFDWDGPSVDTYRNNLGDHVLQADAKEVTGVELRRLAGLEDDEELDLLAGGPPAKASPSRRGGSPG